MTKRPKTPVLDRQSEHFGKANIGANAEDKSSEICGLYVTIFARLDVCWSCFSRIRGGKRWLTSVHWVNAKNYRENFYWLCKNREESAQEWTEWVKMHFRGTKRGVRGFMRWMNPIMALFSLPAWSLRQGRRQEEEGKNRNVSHDGGRSLQRAAFPNPPIVVQLNHYCSPR